MSFTSAATIATTPSRGGEEALMSSSPRTSYDVAMTFKVASRRGAAWSGPALALTTLLAACAARAAAVAPSQPTAAAEGPQRPASPELAPSGDPEHATASSMPTAPASEAPAPPSPAPPPPPPSAPPPAARLPSELEVAQRTIDLALACGECRNACRALGSMQQTAAGLCGLPQGAPARRRCDDAKEHVHSARDTIKASCGQCAPP